MEKNPTSHNPMPTCFATAAEARTHRRVLNESSDNSSLRPFAIVEALLFLGGRPLTAASVLARLFAGLSPVILPSCGRNASPAPTRLQIGLITSRFGTKVSLLSSFRPNSRGRDGKTVRQNQREARLSTSAIEVLSLVRIRQPAPAAKVEACARLATQSPFGVTWCARPNSDVQRGRPALRGKSCTGTTAAPFEWFAGSACKHWTTLPRAHKICNTLMTKRVAAGFSLRRRHSFFVTKKFPRGLKETRRWR